MPQPNKPETRALTVKYKGITDRIITDIRISKPFDPEKPPDPPFPFFETKALWDTGATKSVITKSTALALELIPVGSAIVSHAGGSSSTNTYLVNFYLPNKVGISGVLVSETPDTPNFGAVLGMDVVALGDLAITNFDRQTWMTFRVPSIHPLDFVEEVNTIKFANVNRNSSCPCGKLDKSGKPVRFKHCHGR